jgi:hypothetical protein
LPSRCCLCQRGAAPQRFTIGSVYELKYAAALESDWRVPEFSRDIHRFRVFCLSQSACQRVLYVQNQSASIGSVKTLSKAAHTRANPEAVAEMEKETGEWEEGRGIEKD